MSELLEYYCTNCDENFTNESIWDVHMLDNEPVCENCYEELCATL